MQLKEISVNCSTLSRQNNNMFIEFERLQFLGQNFFRNRKVSNFRTQIFAHNIKFLYINEPFFKSLKLFSIKLIIFNVIIVPKQCKLLYLYIQHAPFTINYFIITNIILILELAFRQKSKIV